MLFINNYGCMLIDNLKKRIKKYTQSTPFIKTFVTFNKVIKK